MSMSYSQTCLLILQSLQPAVEELDPFSRCGSCGRLSSPDSLWSFVWNHWLFSAGSQESWATPATKSEDQAEDELRDFSGLHPRHQFCWSVLLHWIHPQILHSCTPPCPHPTISHQGVYLSHAPTQLDLVTTWLCLIFTDSPGPTQR